MKEFYVEITSSKDSHFWYAEYIGDWFLIDRVDEDMYWTRQPSGYRNFILKEDAKVVERNRYEN